MSISDGSLSLLPVIMAGGSGSRLWPLSRYLRPKQFLALNGSLSMLQATLARLEGLQAAAPLLICNEEHRFLAAEQVRRQGIDGASILLEPEGRNTAPAIALAAVKAMERGEDPLLLVLAADHLIQEPSAFRESVRAALPMARDGRLVTFGVVPTKPETGYGYIRCGEAMGAGFRVDAFVEKPDIKTAEVYLSTGDYLWNSGMFLFRASTYLQELETFAPAIVASARAAIVGGCADLDFIRIDRQAFLSSPADSIDYAVMEKTEQAVVVAMNAGWSDVGSWSSLWEIAEKDPEGNAVSGDVLLDSTADTFVLADHRLVATVGVKDLVVVETKDAVLVAHRDVVQDVKRVVDALKRAHRSEHLNHREVYRPWGVYDSIDHGERYQVKRITVRPGAKLSLQMHHHRAEHWIVVSGVASVTCGDKKILVAENQSVYIPVGEKHCLENPGKIPLELIEVQSGSYLGEDDIVRFEDFYGRS